MAEALCAGVADGLSDARAEVAVCPPYVLIPAAVAALRETAIGVGAQDLDANSDGAFTGQISAAMLADGGCRYVIVGHSERRALYHEDDELVARKTVAALAGGLRPIVCVGETLAEREAGVTEAVVGRQLDAVLSLSADGDNADAFADAVIAYEPVWAIGTGVTATPKQAQAVHAYLRNRLAERAAKLAQCRIIYGGSMKPDNAAELLGEADIDGGLIGGASLNADDFIAICRAAEAN